MNLIGWVIVACEIAFWIMILLGLVIRYVFKRKGLGLFFLALTPVLDLVLLIGTGVDLSNGAIATQVHALSAVYIGVSIAYGKSMIQWADERFQYYFLKQGAKPRQRYGKEHAKHQVKNWLLHLFAYGIGIGLLGLIIFWIDDLSRTEALMATIRIWSVILAIDFLISFSYLIWPKKEKESLE